MPHAITRTSLSLEEIGAGFSSSVHQTSKSTIRFIDCFQSQLHDQVLVDTYMSEGELEQRVMLMIKRKGKGRVIISLRETGFPRPTPGTHQAAFLLAQQIVSMDPHAAIERHNLRLDD
jgi:hypothetical protein